MNRVVACALVALLGQASAAFADDSLLASGARHVRQLASTSMSSAPNPVATAAVPTVRIAGHMAPPSYQTDAGPGNLSKSSHSKMTKAMIYAALGVGFAVSAWEIDRHVLNITPSSLGQRKD
jgi:hypothetical protein